MIFQVHPLIVLSSLSLRERLISFQPVHDGVQRGRLVGLWDLCHYTPPHTPSGCCVLCLLEGRSFSPTVQSHYGLSATPSFLLGCSQEGITRVHYRPASATFWLMRDRDVHARLRASAHTDVTCRMAVRTDVWLLATAEMRVLKTQSHPVQHGACGMSQQ